MTMAQVSAVAIFLLATSLVVTEASVRLRSDYPEMPVGLVSQKSGDITTVPAVGAPLRPYTGVPFRQRLTASGNGESKLGEPLTMNVTTYQGRDDIEQCVWVGPDGRTYTVQANNAEDQTPTVSMPDRKSCKILFKKLEKPHLGNWKCRVQLIGSPKFQDAFFTVTTAIRVSDVRLPRHLKPELYKVHLTPFIIEDNFTIEGFVSINIHVDDSATDVINGLAKNVTLHIKDIDIHENTVRVSEVVSGAASKDLAVVGFGYDNPRQFFIIQLAESLKPGSTIQVSMAFLGQLKNDLSGFYRSTYFDQATNRSEYIATTQFEATDARRALPCFDEPALKAKFQINLGRTKNMSSISNMPLEHEAVPMSDNDVYVWDQYRESLSMSTYLLAFVVSRFTFRQSEPRPNGVQFRIWSRSSASDQTAYAADVGPKVLEFFEQYYKIPFPLPKQDMIAIPDFSAGAMENWGLITYRELALLYEPGKSSMADREYVATVIAHELAHQWFGDLVTMVWWDDLWLNEGFASYMEYLGASHVEPNNGLMDRIPLESIQQTFRQDSLQSSHPISVPVNHPDEINEIFDQISYGKGSAIIRMMANFLGLDTFNAGITNYLNQHKYKNAKQDDLWQALTEAAHASGSLDKSQTVKAVMDTWTLQMGYPVVHISRSYSRQQPEEITVTQDRFLLIEDKTIRDDHQYRWWIPISYTTANGDFSDTKNRLWISPQESRAVKSLDRLSQDQPIIVNVQQTGFYRVNYDDQNWRLINQALMANPGSIHRINRAQIIDDSLTLARAGQLNYTIAMGMTEYLLKEQDYIPWSAAISAFGYLEQMLGRTGGFGGYKDYLMSELQPVLDRLGFDNADNDTFLDVLLRELIVDNLCRLGRKSCRQWATSRFQAWMRNPEVAQSGIPANLRKTVYCMAIEEGNEIEWDFLWKQYLSSNNANEKANILKALACSKEIWILQRYLDMSMDPNSGVRKQDGAGVISGVASNKIGRYIAWNWLRTKWTQISSYFDTAISSTVGKMITACAKDFNTELELSELEKFYEEHLSELGTAKRDTEVAIQNVKANVLWMKNYYSLIVKWLKEARKKIKV